METTALVTGSAERVGPVVDALRAAGATTVGVSDLERLGTALAGFLTVLAHAIRADRAPGKIQVRVLDQVHPAAEIARLALTGESGRRPAAVPADRGTQAEMSYQDWRTEILGLASVEV